MSSAPRWMGLAVIAAIVVGVAIGAWLFGVVAAG